MRIKTTIIALVLASVCPAATYYIDFLAGSDSNPGTSEAFPWKRHPYMCGWKGTYSHSIGDKFIFRGGVKWDNSCFGGPSGPGMRIPTGGTLGSSDYYGVNPRWYSGNSWTRPVFDGEYIASTLFSINASYVTIDNLELCHVSFPTATDGPALISSGSQTNLLIENCFIHGWQTTAPTDAAHGGVIFIHSGQPPFGTGNILNNCVVTNIDNSGSSKPCGVAVRAWQTITHCTIHDVSSAVLFTGDIHSSTIYNVSFPIGNVGFDRSYHENGIYLDNGGYASNIILCYDNLICNTGAGANTVYPNPHGQTQYIYNNVIFGVQSAQLAIEVDPYQYGSEGGGACYVYNNTIVNYSDASPAIHVVKRPGVQLNLLVLANNHVIYPHNGRLTDAIQGVNVGKLITTHNLVVSSSTAKSEGYALSNLYAPTNTSASTVAAGARITEGNLPSINRDILGIYRGMTWDIGAYVFKGATQKASSGSRE